MYPITAADTAAPMLSPTTVSLMPRQESCDPRQEELQDRDMGLRAELHALFPKNGALAGIFPANILSP
jgi:hypothetical protein